MNVLDNGYVKLIETWGSDESIVEAARMSTNKGFQGWDKDEKFLKFLYDNEHSTPFEMAGAVLEIKAPIFIFREWHRHRSQSYNEMSARYTPLPDEAYLPTVERILSGANAVTSNKQAQGLVSEVMSSETAIDCQEAIRMSYVVAQEGYTVLLAGGLPKELARIILPVGRYSKMRSGANLRNWLGFLALRSAPNAQFEIQEYARAVNALLSERFPRTLKLFNDSTKGAA